MRFRRSYVVVAVAVLAATLSACGVPTDEVPRDFDESPVAGVGLLAPIPASPIPG